MDWIHFLFDTSQWPPRWHCGHWTDALGWTHIISDVMIFGAYFAIPLILLYFCYNRRDLPFYKIFILFALFIVFCGCTHLVAAIIFWYPVYRFDALIKICTAVVSWATVFALIPIIPRILKLPKLEENLVETNQQLKKEINTRRDVEKQLANTIEDLKYTNKEMETFTNITSHDLRAPLFSLSGFTEILKKQYNELKPVFEKGLVDSNPEEQENLRRKIEKDIPEALKFISSSINKMDLLTSALLELARLGKRKLNFTPVNTDEILHSTISSLQHHIKEKNVRIEIGKLPNVVADDLSLRQIFGNLIDNAIKYLDPNREGFIQITGEHINGEARFSIKDNGIGIKEEDKGKLFHIFSRIEVKGVSGEGLGLAFIQTLVRRHRGQIYFNSTYGEGSEFVFTIPDGLDKESN